MAAERKRRPSIADHMGRPVANGDTATDEAPPARCCGFLGGRRRATAGKDAPFDQTLVILRHSERLDQVDSSYRSSEEGVRWPHDTPLTERGFILAKEVSVGLAELHEQSPFSSIACSPYRRCLETAAMVSHRLDVPVVIDQEIGEVWDDKMPKDHPPHRLGQDLQDLVKELNIDILNPTLPDGSLRLFGRPPQAWPETMQHAHKRYLVRMADYIEQSANNRLNVIIVTHAPAVVAALDIFQHGHVDIRGINYCARVMARRTVTQKGGDAFSQKWSVSSEDVDAVAVEANPELELEFEDNCKSIENLYVQRKQKRTTTDYDLMAVLAKSTKPGSDGKSPAGSIASSV
eukprot:TRINITY_DN4343_c0_g1_i1.p1 TRINITY_DN4343_c0_g1~~TRINITY_DN4343_c0_g1_i1.p1  ORF type:complete len:347 (-),score=45.42 TRINITY_DN4343_c0_g1_i1:83-1123(-)